MDNTAPLDPSPADPRRKFSRNELFGLLCLPLLILYALFKCSGDPNSKKAEMGTLEGRATALAKETPSVPLPDVPQGIPNAPRYAVRKASDAFSNRSAVQELVNAENQQAVVGDKEARKVLRALRLIPICLQVET